MGSMRAGERMYMRGIGVLGSATRTVWPRVGYIDLSATSVREREPRAEQLRRMLVLGKSDRSAEREV